jgi:N-acetyl-anhydromuramyl-L-alanine amidase AmpD
MNRHQDMEGVAEPMTVPKPPMTWEPSRFFWARTNKVNQAIVWHITQGTNSLTWLTKTGNVSAQYLIQTDTIYNLVRPEDSAWTNGGLKSPNLGNPIIAEWARRRVNPNDYTITIEVEGFSPMTGGAGYSDREKELLVDLTAWLCQEYGIPPDTTHILGHMEIDGIDKRGCPGLSQQEWGDLLARVAAKVANGAGGVPPLPPADNPHAWHDAELDLWVVGPFHAVFAASPDPIREFGRPRTPEYYDAGRGLNVQWFERARLERAPDEHDAAKVTRGLVGLELAQLLGAPNLR